MAKSYEAKPGKYVKITVQDTGVGMDERTRLRIFEPFFTTKEMGRGTGLGLASVYGIIKGHNGIITVESELGNGSTFSIYLPATDKLVIKENKTSEELYLGKETILLVDDEEVITDVSREILETLGYSVLIAGSGKEAIEIYEKKKDQIDLVILDMIMPQMSGGETFDILKAMNSDIKVILSSGYSLKGQAAKIIERGCQAFLQKPFSIKDLSKKVRSVLDRVEL
jgi:CheY-like chemotaxis protein